jgi:hypothetical protein
MKKAITPQRRPRWPSPRAWRAPASCSIMVPSARSRPSDRPIKADRNGVPSFVHSPHSCRRQSGQWAVARPRVRESGAMNWRYRAGIVRSRRTGSASGRFGLFGPRLERITAAFAYRHMLLTAEKWRPCRGRLSIQNYCSVGARTHLAIAASETRLARMANSRRMLTSLNIIMRRCCALCVKWSNISS